MIDIHKCILINMKDNDCQKLVKFPNKKIKSKNILNKVSIQQLDFFKYKFNNLYITSTITVNNDHSMVINNNLLKELKSKHKFIIIPIKLYTGDIYGLFKYKYNWYMFKTPGSNLIKNTTKLEYKIISLIEERFNLPIDIFYVNILYAPDINTEDDLWWSTYIIYNTILNPKLMREDLINNVMIDIILNRINYINFIKEYTDFMKNIVL